MNRQSIKSLFIFTILSPIYALVNMYIFMMFSMHIQENGGLWGDYFLMYFTFSLVIIALPLSFINYKLRSTMNGIWVKISIINFVFVFLFVFIFIASVYYSYQS